MKKKKRKIKLIIAVALVLCVVYFIFSPWIDPAPRAVKKMLRNNIDGYEKIANICLDDYLKYGEEVAVYRFADETKSMRIHFPMNMHEMYSLALSEEEMSCYKKVEESYNKEKIYFADTNLGVMYVYDTFVSFTNAGPYSDASSLVYSSEGTKPKYLKCPGEDYEHVIAKKVADNWYYVYTYSAFWIYGSR